MGACIPAVLRYDPLGCREKLNLSGISLFFSRKDPFHTYNDFNFSGQI